MIDFDDAEKFSLVHHFKISAVYTWGTKDDKLKREEIRWIALMDFPKGPFNFEWYGFRIRVKRSESSRDLDIENIPKLIIDTFSGWQIDRDRSKFLNSEIYKDDTMRWVRALQIEGEFTEDEDETEVWIFGKNMKK